MLGARAENLVVEGLAKRHRLVSGRFLVLDHGEDGIDRLERVIELLECDC